MRVVRRRSELGAANVGGIERARYIPNQLSRFIFVRLLAAGAGATTYPHCRRARLSPIKVRTVTAAITDSRMSRRLESSSAPPLAYSEESGCARIYFTGC